MLIIIPESYSVIFIAGFNVYTANISLKWRIRWLFNAVFYEIMGMLKYPYCAVVVFYSKLRYFTWGAKCTFLSKKSNRLPAESKKCSMHLKIQVSTQSLNNFTSKKTLLLSTSTTSAVSHFSLMVQLAYYCI